MNDPRRMVDEVVRMMDYPYPPVPAGLLRRATAHGSRTRRRRRAARRLCWTLLALAAIVSLLWLSVTEPWSVPPAGTTPPMEDG